MNKNLFPTNLEKERIMKQTLKTIIRNVKSINGNSLAEFATTTALMATLAATAAPKLSEMSEGTKAEKSMNEIDKILTQARNHYQTTADEEGRGRFPGQEKFDVAVGGYGTNETALINDINGASGMTSFTATNLSKWRSVFGVSNSAAERPDGCGVQDDTNITGSDNGTSTNDDYGDGNSYLGHEEWKRLFAGNTLASKYQDGHFAYAVIAGSGSGLDAEPPVLYVIDVENPSEFNNVIEP
jgi:hypothetical protein